MGFWHELAAEMSREWFAANKARYLALWEQPMTALLADVTARLRASYRSHTLEAKVLRIHRDVRFSADKTPYKTHIAGVITLAGKRFAHGGPAALYLHLGLDDEAIGVGVYMFSPEQLPRWRAQIAGKGGAAVARLIAGLRDAGYRVGGHDAYKRVPAPYAADHPRAELLRQKGLTAMFPELPAGLIHRPELADVLAEHAAATAPLVTWIGRTLG